MRHSATFRHVLMLTYSAVVGFALLILLIYHLVSPRIFAANKIDDLIPKGQIIAGYIESTLEGEISSSYLMPLIGRSSSQWEATVWVVDAQGETLIRTQTINGRRVGSLPSRLSRSMLPRVMTGEVATHVGSMEDLAEEGGRSASSSGISAVMDSLSDGTEQGEYGEEEISGSLVAVAVPILFLDQVVGAVFMAQSMTEIMSGMRALSNTIMISLLALALLLLPVVLFFASRLSRPLVRMRSVAMAMASGDFSVRADDTKRDEYGDLGLALNHLSSELGSTISTLKLERNRLESLINGLSEGIIALDHTNAPPLINPAVHTLLEIPEDCTDVRAAAPEVFAMLDEAMSSGRIVRETIWRGNVALRVSVSPLAAADGGAGGCVAIVSDVTSAERLEQTRRDYVANVSHELRTPLTALRALIEPLRDGLVTSEEQRQQIYDVVLRETMRLSRLVSDMLELSRLQSGTASLQRSVFSPLPLLSLIRETYAPYAEDYQQTFRYEVPESLPDVSGNPDRTQQVLVALLDNAFKYTPEGGTVTLRAEVQPDVLLISVCDTGIGISREDLPHVFDRFFRGDAAHNRETPGNGLGLAIAKNIVEAHKGTITAESSPEKGTTFTVSFA